MLALILAACTVSTDKSIFSKEKRILSKIEKNYNKYKGYQCKADIKFFTGDKKSIYTIEEKYIRPDKYKLKILSPRESKGIIMLNTDDKVYIEHPSIDKSISLVTMKSLNKQMLVGDFFENISHATMLKNQIIDKKEYYVFEFSLIEKNKYRDSGRIWVEKRKLIPYKLNIFDKQGSIQVEINYDKFKFTKIDLF